MLGDRTSIEFGIASICVGLEWLGLRVRPDQDARDENEVGVLAAAGQYVQSFRFEGPQT